MENNQDTPRITVLKMLFDAILTLEEGIETIKHVNPENENEEKLDAKKTGIRLYKDMLKKQYEYVKIIADKLEPS